MYVRDSVHLVSKYMGESEIVQQKGSGIRRVADMQNCVQVMKTGVNHEWE